MLGKRKMEMEEAEMEDNLEDDSAVDMEVVRERMKLVPIPDVNFQEIDSDIFDDQTVLKYDDGVKGTKLPKLKNEGPLFDMKKCIGVNSGIKRSQCLAAEKCNRNGAELEIAYDESAELDPTHHTMSDICPPDFSMWTAEDDLLLKNAVEAGAALEALAKGAVRFSHRFTVTELRERWHALLYDPDISAKAAAGMVEVELSQMGHSKPNQSNKLKGKDDIVLKFKLQNVRNHYYQMRKRIDAERIMPIEDNSLFPYDTVVVCKGNPNEVVQEQSATMHEGLPLTVGMEGAAVAPPFGLSEECLDIAFSQMVSFLASGGLEGDAGSFPPTNMDSLEVNPAPISLMSNGCFDFSRHDPSVMPSASTVGSGNEYIPTENIHHLVEDMPQTIVHNAVGINDSSYVVESSLPLDAITASTINNGHTMNPVPVANHNPGTFQSIDTKYGRAEGFEQAVLEENISASGMLSQPSIRNWNGDAAFVMPPTNVDIKVNVDEPTLSTEYKGDTISPREPVSDGHLMSSSLSNKEELLISSGMIQSFGAKGQHEPRQKLTPDFLRNSSEGVDVYALRDGQDMPGDSGYIISGNPLKDESHVRPSQCVGNMAVCCSNNSPVEVTVCVQSDGLEMAPVAAYTSPVPAQAGQEWSHNAVKSEVTPLTFSVPMNCTLNTEDINVPYNDEFNPSAYQEPPPISTAVLSSYVEQTTAWGSLSTNSNLDNRMPLCKGLPVKEEPETIETLVEAPNELKPLAFKDEENNKSSTDCQQVKMEMLEFPVPSVVCEDVSASKNDCHPGIPSSIIPTAIFPVALQQGILTVPSMLENCAGNKFNLLSSHKCIQGSLHGNDGYVDFTRSLQFEVALPNSVQDNSMQFSQAASVTPIGVGLDDFQAMSCEEAAVNQFPGNQEDESSDSDEELPNFSDVEAMILDMDMDPGDDEILSARAEFKHMYKQHRKVIIRLEQTANSAMQRSLASNGAYAILYGLHLRYFIRKKEVTIGRVTQENIVDIDLGKEGRANKVSRRQATIKLKEDGLFYLENHGRRTISVNSRDIKSGQWIRLGSNYLIE
ncbi:hypothetical protein KI387_014515, partial [Taxus chinensis]